MGDVSNDRKTNPVPKKVNELNIAAGIQFFHLVDAGEIVEQVGDVVVGDAERANGDALVTHDEEGWAFG